MTSDLGSNRDELPDTFPACESCARCVLDADLYEEVEADRTARDFRLTAVVVLASVAGGIGELRERWACRVSSSARWRHWLDGSLWAFIAYWIGTRLLPEPQTVADHGELLRTIGFSSAPGMLTAIWSSFQASIHGSI